MDRRVPRGQREEPAGGARHARGGADGRGRTRGARHRGDVRVDTSVELDARADVGGGAATAERVLRRPGVSTGATPGKDCKSAVPGCFRMCFAAVQRAALLEAVRRLKGTLGEVRVGEEDRARASRASCDYRVSSTFGFRLARHASAAPAGQPAVEPFEFGSDVGRAERARWRPPPRSRSILGSSASWRRSTRRSRMTVRVRAVSSPRPARPRVFSSPFPTTRRSLRAGPRRSPRPPPRRPSHGLFQVDQAAPASGEERRAHPRRQAHRRAHARVRARGEPARQGVRPRRVRRRGVLVRRDDRGDAHARARADARADARIRARARADARARARTRAVARSGRHPRGAPRRAPGRPSRIPARPGLLPRGVPAQRRPLARRRRPRRRPRRAPSRARDGSRSLHDGFRALVLFGRLRGRLRPRGVSRREGGPPVDPVESDRMARTVVGVGERARRMAEATALAQRDMARRLAETGAPRVGRGDGTVSRGYSRGFVALQAERGARAEKTREVDALRRRERALATKNKGLEASLSANAAYTRDQERAVREAKAAADAARGTSGGFGSRASRRGRRGADAHLSRRRRRGCSRRSRVAANHRARTRRPRRGRAQDASRGGGAVSRLGGWRGRRRGSSRRVVERRGDATRATTSRGVSVVARRGGRRRRREERGHAFLERMQARQEEAARRRAEREWMRRATVAAAGGGRKGWDNSRRRRRARRGRPAADASRRDAIDRERHSRRGEKPEEGRRKRREAREGVQKRSPRSEAARAAAERQRANDERRSRGLEPIFDSSSPGAAKKPAKRPKSVSPRTEPTDAEMRATASRMLSTSEGRASLRASGFDLGPPGAQPSTGLFAMSPGRRVGAAGGDPRKEIAAMRTILDEVVAHLRALHMAANAGGDRGAAFPAAETISRGRFPGDLAGGPRPPAPRPPAPRPSPRPPRDAPVRSFWIPSNTQRRWRCSARWRRARRRRARG